MATCYAELKGRDRLRADLTQKTKSFRIRFMTPREIHSLMRRLCYVGVSAVDGYRHLMRSDELDRNLVNQLIDDYITTEEVIVYASAKDCANVRRPAAFGLIQEYRLNDTCAKVQVVAADFSSRIVVEPIGVGVGEHRRREL